jgi:MATE family multidrug resistance protein
MNAHREVWRLAWPLILSNLSVPLLGITDVAVVGHLPEPHHLGAVAIGAMVFSVVYFAFGFLRMGTTGLTAQAYGRGDPVELRAGLGRPILLALAIGAILLASTGGIVRLSTLTFAPSPAVAAELESYLRIRLLGAPAALMNLVLLGWLLGLQNARGPMTLLIVTNVLNIGLDLLFVLAFGWAVPGVAAATVCAEYGGLALGLWLARRELRGLAGAWSRTTLLDLPAFRRLLRVNRDIFLRSCSLEAAFLTFTALGSRQGEVILAANAILLNFQLLASYGLDGFAHAAEAMAGRAVGARDRAGFRAAVRAGLHWSAALAAMLAALFLAGGPMGIRLMTGLEEVRATSGAFLPYMVLSPVVSVWAFLLDGVFIGATRTAEMRNGMALALLLFWALAFALVPVLGNHGLWLAFLAFMAARGLWLGLVFLRIERNAGFVAAGPGLRGRTA